MTKTLKFENKKYELSNTGIYVPSREKFSIDHPILQKAITKSPSLLAMGMAALLMLPQNIFAQENEDTQSIFAGSVMSSTSDPNDLSIDSIIDYRNDNGSQFTAESINPPLGDLQSHNLALGIKTPLLENIVQIVASGETDCNFDNWGYQGGLIFNLEDNIKLRNGVIQSSNNILGMFVGLEYINDYFKIDFDLWHDGSNRSGIDAHGFLGGNIPTPKGSLYLGAGSQGRNGIMNFLAGWIPNNKAFGFFNRTKINSKDDSQSGKLIIAPEGFSYNKGTFDYRGSIYSETGMTNIGNPILHGWASFDAFATDGENGNFAIVGNWDNSKSSVNADLELFYRPNKNLFVGMGFGNKYSKDSSKNSPNLMTDIYTTIPKTPLEAWVNLNLNLKTGNLNEVQAYLGFCKSF